MKTRRSRLKPFAVMSAVLVVGIAAVCLLVYKAQERKEFVGRVDPASGYRCRFTLSPTWRCQDDFDPTLDTLDRATFTPSPRGFIRTWMDVHLRPHSLSLGKSTANTMGMTSPSITLLTYRNLYMEADSLESIVHPPYDSTRSLLRHLRIDGFPAIYAVDVIPFANYHEVALYVYIPAEHILCRLTEQTFDDDLEQANREMQAIISSFHVERVAVETDGIR